MKKVKKLFDLFFSFFFFFFHSPKMLTVTTDLCKNVYVSKKRVSESVECTCTCTSSVSVYPARVNIIINNVI